MSPSFAQTFPEPGRPIIVMVGFAAGGTVDLMAREIAPALSKALGTTVVVEDKPGANGVIAAMDVVHAKADGYTLLFTFAGTFAQYPYTMAHIPYNVFKDFTPIGMVATGPMVLESNVALPVKNVQELVAYAKANPGKLRIASPGVGSSPYIYAAKFMQEANIHLLQVPYKGAGDAMPDLLSGRVQLAFDGAPSAVQSVATGRLRMLGITAAQRSPLLPDVPTLSEQGVPGLDLPGWNGYFGPPNLPRPIVEKLNAAITTAVNDPDVKALFAKGLWEAKSSTPEELTQRVKLDNERWGKIIKDAGITPQ